MSNPDYALSDAGTAYVDRQNLIKEAFEPMRRALLAVEWRSGYCAGCNEVRPSNHGHNASCLVDAAFTKAGLPDQESRDAARKELGI